MIADWLVQAPAFFAAVLVMFVPGVAALYIFGLRGLALLSAAPLFSVAATSVGALILGIAGVPWTLLSWSATIAAMIALSWGARIIWGIRDPQQPSEHRWLLPTTIGIGGLIGAWRLIAYIALPSAISQTNDAVFHMNAVRFVLETANASSLHVSGVVGGGGFYPAAWHALVSLVVLLTGTDIAVAANMLTLVIGALVWPLGLAWMTWKATGSRTIAAFAALMSAALQAFPLLMFQWGVLFPNALSTALIPAAIALLLSLPAWNEGGGRWRSIGRSTLLVLVAAAALGLSQPSALIPWLAAGIVWLTFRLLARRTELGLLRVLVLLALAWIGLGALWFGLARGTSGSHWPPFRGKAEVFLDILLNGQLRMPFAFGVSALMIVGLVCAARRHEERWIVAAWAGVSVLYIGVAAVGHPLVRGLLLAPWYADPYRIASLAPILVIPLAAIGLDAIIRAVGTRTPARGHEGLVLGISVAVITILMVLLVSARSVAMPLFLEADYEQESRYHLGADTYLSSDERELLESLPEIVEPGARVLGNPSTGTGFGYMLSGVDVFPRNWSQPRSAQWRVLAEQLRDAAQEPAVCEALAAYGDPEYVLDFGPGEDSPGRFELPGMTGFRGQPGFELVGEAGEASLWRITACTQQPASARG